MQNYVLNYQIHQKCLLCRPREEELDNKTIMFKARRALDDTYLPQTLLPQSIQVYKKE